MRTLREKLRSRGRLLAFAGVSAQTALDVEMRAARGQLTENAKTAIKKRLASRMLGLLGMELHMHGTVPPPPRTGLLVVANHRTAVDIGVLMSLLGGTFLSRAEVAGWPIAGQLAKRGDSIFVERGDGRSGALAIRAMRRRLKAGGTVVAFTEGTTHAGDVVRPFQQGAFSAAVGLDVQVVAAGLAYPPGIEYVNLDFVEHIGRIAARPRTPVGVAFGAPKSVAGKRATLVSAMHGEVQTLTDRARQLIE
ncbi:MAG: lysophospholipid acyltransferase family protein [Myxococcota bacterium]